MSPAEWQQLLQLGLSAVGGIGGISAIVLRILDRRKNNADAQKMESEARKTDAESHRIEAETEAAHIGAMRSASEAAMNLIEQVEARFSTQQTRLDRVENENIRLSLENVDTKRQLAEALSELKNQKRLLDDCLDDRRQLHEEIKKIKNANNPTPPAQPQS